MQVMFSVEGGSGCGIPRPARVSREKDTCRSALSRERDGCVIIGLERGERRGVRSDTFVGRGGGVVPRLKKGSHRMHWARVVTKMLYRVFLSKYTVDIDERCGTYQKVASSPSEPGSEEYDVGNYSLWSGLINSDRLGVHPSLSRCHLSRSERDLCGPVACGSKRERNHDQSRGGRDRLCASRELKRKASRGQGTFIAGTEKESRQDENLPLTIIHSSHRTTLSKSELDPRVHADGKSRGIR